MSHSDSTPYDAPAIPSHAEVRRWLWSGHERELAPLRRLDMRKRLAEMSAFVALWLASMLLNYVGIQLASGVPALVFRILGTLGMILAINGFILLMHEGMHGILFADRALNRWVSVGLGLNFCMAFSAYRVLHTRHHRYLGDPRDPDDYNNYTHRPRLVWLMQYLRLIIGPYLYILVMPFLAYKHAVPAERRAILQEYALMALVYGLCFSLIPLRFVLGMWLFPLMGAALMTSVRGLSQHGVTDASDPYLASRTIEASPLVRWIMLNENYHLEHHLFPEVPSYRLEAAHKVILPRLPRRIVVKSYRAFLARFFIQSLRMDGTPIGLADPARA